MYATTDRLFTPAFIALTVSELAYFTAGGLVIAITSFFVTGPVAAGEAAVGMTFAAFSVATLVLRPLAGQLADHHGRRPLLVGGALLCTVVLAGHLVVVDLGVLIALRVLLGIAEACFFVAAFAALADLAPPGRAGEALSFNSLALYLGLAGGPMIGELALAVGGYAVAWIVAAGLTALAAGLALTIPETAPLRPGGPRPALLHRAALAPGSALFCGIAAMAAFLALAGPFADRLGLDTWSVTYLAFGLVVVGCRIVFARLPDRVPPLRLAAGALAVSAAGVACVAAVPGIAGFFAGTVMLAVGVAFLTPAVFAAIFAVVAPSERGSAAGTATAFIDLAFGGGPLLAGWVASSAGVAAAFGLAALVAVVGAVGTLVASGPSAGRLGGSVRPGPSAD
jgi:MFS family permease